MNTFDLEFGLRTLHCKYGHGQLYGYYVVNIGCQYFMWTINLCQLDLHWTLSHMFKQQIEPGNFEGIQLIPSHTKLDESGLKI